jgi:hypothetical protein
MTTSSTTLAQSRVVGFFAICCVFAGFGLIRNLMSGARLSFTFGLAQSTFVLFSGAAAWYLYQSKRVGWYLGLLAILDWFLGLTRMKISWNVWGNLVSIGMVVVLVWLFLPSVKAHFDLKF